MRTSLAAQNWFLLALALGQWSVLAGGNAVLVFACLIAVKAFQNFIDIYATRREGDRPK